MVKEFDEVVFSAPVGEVQGPVQTQFGFHLVEVTQRTD
jgi:peptidyl-prolyl cis-trans isomerase C